MKTVKTRELRGLALCYAVTMLEIPNLVWGDTIGIHHASHQIVVPNMGSPDCYSPFRNWKMFGPIIDRENITIIRCDDDYGVDADGFCNNKRIPVWGATTGQHIAWKTQYEVSESDVVYGSTALEAAMRCFVVSKLGIEVEIPDELVKEKK